MQTWTAAATLNVSPGAVAESQIAGLIAAAAGREH